jgi:uncharacterized repeat protein (TIGR03809 family)
MTHQLDVAARRQLSARWCALAERRLEHLTELFESGRWSRYHTERSLLENIREAKNAVTTWRALSRGERLEHHVEFTVVTEAAVMKATAGPATDLPEVLAQPIRLVPSIDIELAEHDIVMPEDIEDIMVPQPEPVAPHIDVTALEHALSIGDNLARSEQRARLDAIEQRYPALRHAM